MSITIFSVNARGIRDMLKRKALFLFCKGKQADFCFIQETHACKEDVLFWKSQWGSDMWFSFGVSNRTAGVAILKDKFSGQVISHKTDDQGRWIIILVEINQVKVIIINIYATNNKTMNGLIFQDIEGHINSLHSKFPSAEVIWGGDFNTVFDGIQDRCPPKVDSSINELSNVCLRLNIFDIWRYKNPTSLIYTWSNKDRSLQSRIDFWLISEHIKDKVEFVTIEPSVLTDHKGISIKVNFLGNQSNRIKRGYWKLNNSLLKHNVFCAQIKTLISKYWQQASTNQIYGKYWEQTKFEIRKLAISYGKSVTRKKKENENKIINEIIAITCKNDQHLSNKDLLNLATLQNDLDNIYEEKARGAFVRSRRKWMEAGEKNTKYFFNLEKRNREITSVNKLVINGATNENPKDVSNFVSEGSQMLFYV